VASTWEATVKQLGRTIREKRLALNISQVKLAQLADISRSRVQQLENAEVEANPSLGVLFKISGALKIGLGDLLSPPPRRQGTQGMKASKSARTRAARSK
jgi:transcriptional regulator with XRE-family HTH domain